MAIPRVLRARNMPMMSQLVKGAVLKRECATVTRVEGGINRVDPPHGVHSVHSVHSDHSDHSDHRRPKTKRVSSCKN